MAPQIRSVFNIIRRIGQGGFGVVYEVSYIDKPDQVYALKLITEENGNIDTINQELRASYLVHPPNQIDGLIWYYETLELMDNNKRVLGLLMPVIDGEEMMKYFMAYKVNDDNLIILMENLFTTLDEMHQRGMYHRDIKPSNIIITNVNEPWIVDLGAACAIDDCQRRYNTNYTQVMIPPEYFDDHYEFIPEKFDVYLMGLTFIRSIMWDARTPQGELIHKFSNLKFNEELKSILIDCVLDDPNERPTAWMVLDRLHNL